MVVPARKVDLMAEPGPYASTQRPQFEYDALASVFSDAATVKTLGAPDGDSVQASTLSFPAATARNTPEFQRLVTAWSSAGDLPPPSDRSEEHTSELQSLTNLVCRLLLEKKNKKT